MTVSTRETSFAELFLASLGDEHGQEAVKRLKGSGRLDGLFSSLRAHGHRDQSVRREIERLSDEFVTVRASIAQSAKQSDKQGVRGRMLPSGRG